MTGGCEVDDDDKTVDKGALSVSGEEARKLNSAITGYVRTTERVKAD